MATTVTAIKRIAAEIERPFGSVEVLSRHLKNTPDNLYAKGLKGGGRNSAHVETADVINLLLGVLAAEVLTEAPTLVRQYRALIPRVVIIAEKQDVTEAVRASRPCECLLRLEQYFKIIEKPIEDLPETADFQFFTGLTLGEALERIVNSLVPTDGVLPFELGGLTIFRGKPRAAIRYVNAARQIVEVNYFPAQPSLPSMEDCALELKPAAPICIPAMVPAQIFPVLAELVRDTRQLGGALPFASGSPEKSTPPQDDPETASDLVSRPHANAEVSCGAGNTAEGSDGAEKNQSPSSACHGSPNRFGHNTQSTGEKPCNQRSSPLLVSS